MTEEDDIFIIHGIPERMRGGLVRYIENHIKPGDFLTAVLRNDLRGAFERADTENQMIMMRYVTFLVNEAPCTCWGSPKVVKEWVENGS